MPPALLQNMDKMLPILVPTSSVIVPTSSALGPEDRGVSPQPHGCRHNPWMGVLGSRAGGHQLFHTRRGTGRCFLEPTPRLTTDLAPSHDIDSFFP